MRAGMMAAVVAASVLGGGSAWAACPGTPGHCINLDLVPQISQQIVATEHIVAPPKDAPATESQPAYTGPTVGLATNVRRAPTLGYRWALH